jgi:hypothetical protein
MKLRRLGQTAVVLAAGYLAALAVTRRWHQHWGATDREITTPLPGDDLIPDARLASTHAITIQAPAGQVWPWLAQMGYEDRAGSYSYDRFERSVGRNLYQLDPNIAPLAVGDAMPFYPGAPMTVAVADPPHALVLWQVTSGGKAIDPVGPWGEDYVAWSWAFVLEPVNMATTPAAGPHAGQLPAGVQVGAGHVAAGGAGPLRHGSPSAARHPTTRRDRPAP